VIAHGVAGTGGISAYSEPDAAAAVSSAPGPLHTRRYTATRVHDIS